MNDWPTGGDFLSTDDLVSAFEALSQDEKLKLAAIEAIKMRGTGFARGELVHEAFCRALTGARNCPRDISFMAFMVETMRSLASHDRKRSRRSESLTGPDAEDGDADPIATGPSPEDDLMQKQDAETIRAIHRLFDDDPDAQLVLLGWQEDLRGAALREATGLDQGQLDYAIKRIRTKTRKKYPKGQIA